MALRFTNTMTRRLEEFAPLVDEHVRVYTCGPTVHDFAHIGNFRTYTFEDLLRRYLKYKGYRVTQVMNLTDIDDKTIRKSRAMGVSLKQYTDVYKEAFFKDLDILGIERAEYYPAATEYIPDMVNLVKRLIEKNMAYEIDGNYYFPISKFPDYGKLSHIDLKGLKPGARIAADEYEKDSVSDFALWKAWDAEDGDVFWKTELGKGRPGWHLECSVMSMKLLGECFDIHCGGVDNLFPHHENEIAQSEAATGKKFVNFWLHSEHLIVDGRKMSKSLNNFYTLRDILDKGYPAGAVRYVLMATHYRQQLNFTFEGLNAARNALERYNDFYINLRDYSGGASSGEADGYIDKFISGFETGLDEDLNISASLGAVFDFIRDINRLKSENKLSADERNRALRAFERIDGVLNLLQREADALESEIERLIRKRVEARLSKDFMTADKIRQELYDRGIILEDGPEGTKWKRKL
jgi:cysteinyl-tRNA synthetase